MMALGEYGDGIDMPRFEHLLKLLLRKITANAFNGF
jgi:hypothetical protein